MTKGLEDLQAFVDMYGGDIPALPGRHRIARYTVEMPVTWWEQAQSIANNPEFRYNGDVGMVFREGLMRVFAAKLDEAGKDSSVVRWEMEVAADRKVEETFETFKAMANTRIKDADGMTGEKAAGVLWGLVRAVRTHADPRIKARMTNYLKESRRFRAAMKKFGGHSSALTLWWEALA